MLEHGRRGQTSQRATQQANRDRIRLKPTAQNVSRAGQLSSPLCALTEGPNS
jgi:hypothetical protein